MQLIERSRYSFQYPILDNPSSQIRVLMVEPGSDYRRIKTFLLVVSLEEMYFWALSYTWSDGSSNRHIICNGQKFPVSRNLYSALRRFRSFNRNIDRNLRGFIWVDQLCINQDDPEEKNQQVQMMGQIYAKAGKVIVWLGGTADRNLLAMQILLFFVEQAERDEKEGNQPRTYLENSYIQSIWRASGFWDQIRGRGSWLPLFSTKGWRSVRPLLERRWFSRIWVVQEVALAKDTLVWCGDEYFEWKHIARGVTILPAPQAITRIRELRNENKPLDLLTLAIEFRCCEAKDPRDKLYGLLGMCDHNIKPDYSLKIEHLYIEFARQYICATIQARSTDISPVNNPQTDFFRILYSAGRLHQRHGHRLPSWVPDWSVNPISVPVWPGNNWAAEEQEFAAGGKPRPDPGPIRLSDGLVLHLTAKKWDTVASASTLELNLSKSRARRRKQAIIAWFQEVIRIALVENPKAYPSGEEKTAALKRTLLLNREAEEVTALSWNYDIYDKHWFKDIISDKSLTAYLWNGGGRDYSYVDAASNGNGRVVFVTTQGYFGLGPRGIRQGDVVYIIPGGDVPIVLQPAGNDFILLGECYADGAMSGAVMENQRIPFETIALV